MKSAQAQKFQRKSYVSFDQRYGALFVNTFDSIPISQVSFRFPKFWIRNLPFHGSKGKVSEPKFATLNRLNLAAAMPPPTTSPERALEQALSSALSSVAVRFARFQRYGITISGGNRISAWTVFVRWALCLACLNVVISFFHKGNLSYHSDLSLDGNSFFNGRRLVFAASGGRSGSGYLSRVLACGDGVMALHEPLPKMNEGDLLDVLLRGKRSATAEDRGRRKLSGMRELLMGTDERVVYAETSHMFIKTFGDVILEELGDLDDVNVTVVVPVRDRVDVVLSQLKLGWFSPNHSGRNMWYYAPRDIDESERKLTRIGDDDALSMAVDYNADIAMRIEELRNLIEQRHNEGRWSGVRILDVRLSDIAPEKREGIERFLRTVGVEPLRDRMRILGASDENKRDGKKEDSMVNVRREDVRQKVMTS